MALMTYEVSQNRYKEVFTKFIVGWTLNGCIQPHVDIYCSQTTFVEVQRAFPYLVAKEFASGGGDVSSGCNCRWDVI